MSLLSRTTSIGVSSGGLCYCDHLLVLAGRQQNGAEEGVYFSVPERSSSEVTDAGEFGLEHISFRPRRISSSLGTYPKTSFEGWFSVRSQKRARDMRIHGSTAITRQGLGFLQLSRFAGLPRQDFSFLPPCGWV